MANETKIVITAATAQAESALRGLSNSLFNFKSIAAGLTGALSVTAFAGFIKSSIDAADHLNDLAQKTGTSVEALAGLKLAADQNGTSLETVALASKKLATVMAENPDVLKKFGITAKDTTGALVQLADIFAAMPDGVQKTALAVKLLGKNGEEMIPFLNQGAAALRSTVEEGKRLNQTTAEMGRQADQFNDDLAKLNKQAGGLGITMANELLPSLVNITTAMSEAGKESGLLAAIWVGMGGAAANILGVDEAHQTKKRIEELTQSIATAQKQLEAGSLKPTGTGNSFFSFLIPDIKLSSQALANLRTNLALMKAELARLQVKPAAPAVVNKDGAKGRALYGALGGDGKEKKKASDFDPEGDFLDAVVEARYKNSIKEMEEAEKARAQAVAEANRIIFDIDPIARAEAEWKKLLDLKAQGLLTDEQAGKAYRKTFEDIDKSGTDAFKSLESAVRGWGEAFTDEMTNVVRTAEMDFDSLADSITNDLIRIQIQKNVTDPLVNAGTSFLDGIFKFKTTNANGGVYSGPGIGAFSNSVVDKPTLFPFARGIGLMGEAGPEAILPLTRINGKLGVMAQGGGTQITINASIDARGADVSVLPAIQRALGDLEARIYRNVPGINRQQMIRARRTPY